MLRETITGRKENFMMYYSTEATKKAFSKKNVQAKPFALGNGYYPFTSEEGEQSIPAQFEQQWPNMLTGLP